MTSEQISPSASSAINDDQILNDEVECAVCLQNCIHPVKLPCTHIFCFLCVKGLANQSKRCAMCRQEIPADFLENPFLLNGVEIEEPETFETYQWFYEGRNGWWQYDERTNADLENAYTNNNRTCEVLVAGFLYIIDFDRMIQHRRNDLSRRRRIKRDLATIPKKGIAGIKTLTKSNEPAESSSSDCQGVSDLSSQLSVQNTTTQSDNTYSTQVAAYPNDRTLDNSRQHDHTSRRRLRNLRNGTQLTVENAIDESSNHPNSPIHLSNYSANSSDTYRISELDDLQLLHANIRESLELPDNTPDINTLLDSIEDTTYDDMLSTEGEINDDQDSQSYIFIEQLAIDNLISNNDMYLDSADSILSPIIDDLNDLELEEDAYFA